MNTNHLLPWESYPLAERCLLELGIDISLDECNRYIEINDRPKISQSEFNRVKDELRTRDPGKEYYTKEQILHLRARYLLGSPEGISALRHEIRRSSPDVILSVLGFEGTLSHS